MGYKPTLGGLKKAQEFLDQKGLKMPVFQTDIYEGGSFAVGGWVPGTGQTADLDEAIRTHGPLHEVRDVRLGNAQKDGFILFSDWTRAGFVTAMQAKDDGWDVLIGAYVNKANQALYEQLKAFLDSGDGAAFVSIARWGKPNVTLLDKLKFRFMPKSYSDEVFV